MVSDLFPDTLPTPRRRAKPRVLMHVCDAGDVPHGVAEDFGKPLCKMRCKKCGIETDWLIFETVTAAKRGIHCPNCNKDTR